MEKIKKAEPNIIFKRCSLPDILLMAVCLSDSIKPALITEPATVAS
jgi:hypothetical protein